MSVSIVLPWTLLALFLLVIGYLVRRAQGAAPTPAIVFGSSATIDGEGTLAITLNTSRGPVLLRATPEVAHSHTGALQRAMAERISSGEGLAGFVAGGRSKATNGKVVVGGVAS